MNAKPAVAPPSAAPAAPVWHALEPADVLDRIGSSPSGLTSDEAARRLARVGANAVSAREGPGALVLFARQLRSPVVYLLLAASALAFALGKPVDSLVVLAAVVVNAIIGFLQEHKAGKAIAALSRLVPHDAIVLRGAERRTIPAAELVPGDVVLLASGDRVPADLRLLSARQLRVEEAALTGESVPSAKDPSAVGPDASLGDRRSMLFGGTHVVSGAATAVVVETGDRTELGRISAMLRSVEALQTPLTRALARLGGWLTVAVALVAGVLFVVAVLRGYGIGDGLLVAVSFAVAAIPEGLPAIITIALAIGVQRMAARRAVVRHLPSVETLGATTVICSDKTGTLTRNEMTVRALWTPAGHVQVSGVGWAPEGQLLSGGVALEAPPADVVALVRAGLLNNDAALRRSEGGGWAIAGDPTEAALVTAAAKGGLDADEERARWRRLDVIPFESERQFMATLHQDPSGGRVALVKGAPEVVLDRCAVDRSVRDRALAEVHGLARDGMRVLAFAEKRLPAGHDTLAEEDVAGGLSVLGLAGMIDPPRPEAVAAVAGCHGAGIAVKMITGDHRGTAEAIGAQLGLAPPGTPALTGAEIERLDDAALRRAAAETHVFARVAPEHKLRLVRALQENGHVVAMTGDGVNDAPALKQADIGVAMGITGTAVSKEAADVVLADDNFATISVAVEEGRRIHDNLVKSLAFVLPTNLGMALMLVAGVLFLPVREVDGALHALVPVLPTQLLWINLFASVTLSLPLAFEVRERDVMRRPPRDPRAPIVGAFVLGRTVLVAVLMAAGSVGLFLWEYEREVAIRGHALALAEAQTLAVTTIVLFQVLYLLNCRSLRDSVFTLGLFSNRTVFAGVGLLAVLHAGFVYLPFMNEVFGTAPLDGPSLALSAAVASVVLPVVSVEKWLRSRGRRARATPAAPRTGTAGGTSAPARTWS